MRILTADQIQFYRDDGYLVVPRVFSEDQISRASDLFHIFLKEEFGIDHDNLATSKGLENSELFGIIEIYYQKWKLELHENENFVDIMRDLVEATYASEPSKNLDDLFYNKLKSLGLKNEVIGLRLSSNHIFLREGTCLCFKNEKKMSAQDVEGMTVEQLCSWLKTKLDDIDWEIALNPIIQHKVRGKSFLSFSFEDWVKVVGIPAGVAKFLVLIAESFRRQDAFQLPMLALISHPSSATMENIQGRVDHGNVLMHQECFWALLFVLKNQDSFKENQFTALAEAFFDEYSNMQNRTQINGIFGQRISMTFKEISMSSSLAAHLQNYLPQYQGMNLMWYHQFEDPSGGKMDIMLAGLPKDASKTKTVYAVIETARDCQNKHWQALSYAINASWFLNSPSQLFYVVELEFDSKISLYACLCLDGRLKSAFIWEGSYTLENLAMIIFVLVHCTTQNINQFRALGPNCTFDGEKKKVYKVFDYRKRNIPKESRRKPSEFYMSLLQAVPDVEEENLTIISYPYICGAHIPSKCSDFADILVQLAFMHSKSFVHADIRLSNMLFLPNGTSTLIDFDFSGTHDHDKYPSGFAVEDLIDTVRHVSAIGGAVMRFDHDLFSMAAVMDMFTCSNELWEKGIQEVRHGNLDGVAAFLRQVSDELKIKVNLELDYGTGSPQQLQKRKKPSRAMNVSRWSIGTSTHEE